MVPMHTNIISIHFGRLLHLYLCPQLSIQLEESVSVESWEYDHNPSAWRSLENSEEYGRNSFSPFHHIAPHLPHIELSHNL